jgi:hypothetical protein
MREYHEVWLNSHPHRTREWLEQKLAEGFDVHHIDGDHSNNSPSNLILVECADHAMLHGIPQVRILAVEIRRRKIAERNRLEDERGFSSGRFVPVTVKANVYWYFDDRRTKKRKYIGRTNESLDRVARDYNRSKKDESAWLSVKELVAT